MTNIELIKSISQLTEIIKNNELVVINCGLTLCAPCKRISPDYEILSQKYTSVIFCKITMDVLDKITEASIKKYLNLTKYPSLILMHNGNNIEHIIGPYLDKLEKLLESMTGSEDF
tara:strand:- start:1108 stop:1455 length:348 start_codon:yes stop_codon:yes gene_type:complete